MISNAPARTADVFKNAVSHEDLSKITSFSQITDAGNAFSSLTNSDLFEALLNDVSGMDRQSYEMFKDLNKAGLGIQAFAEASFRRFPRRAVARFLNMPEYSYHEADMAELYYAVNTWLSFFGSDEISADWKICPFCASPMKDYVCTNSECKAKTHMCIKNMLALDDMRSKLEAGQEVADPKFWDKIKDGSEFDLCFKTPIKRLRDGKTDDEANEARSGLMHDLSSQISNIALKTGVQDDFVQDKVFSDNTEEKQDHGKIVEHAINRIRGFVIRVKLETTKQAPDFEKIMAEFKDDPLINEVSALGIVEIQEKIDEFVASIGKYIASPNVAATADDRNSDFVQRVALLREKQSQICAVSDWNDPELYKLRDEADEIAQSILDDISSGEFEVDDDDVKTVGVYMNIISPAISEYNSIFVEKVSTYNERSSALMQEIENASNIGGVYDSYVTALYESAFSGDSSAEAKTALIDSVGAWFSKTNALFAMQTERNETYERLWTETFEKIKRVVADSGSAE